jgi:hypothetical protein
MGMLSCRVMTVGLVFVTSLALGGCFSRQLMVMELGDALEAIADELCAPPLKDKVAKVTLVTATGASVGIDAATLGFPISASGNVADSTTVEADVVARCLGPAERTARNVQRPVYRYDLRTGVVTPLNDQAKARMKKK